MPSFDVFSVTQNICNKAASVDLFSLAQNNSSKSFSFTFPVKKEVSEAAEL